MSRLTLLSPTDSTQLTHQLLVYVVVVVAVTGQYLPYSYWW